MSFAVQRDNIDHWASTVLLLDSGGMVLISTSVGRTAGRTVKEEYSVAAHLSESYFDSRAPLIP